MIKKLLIATTNINKLKEINNILSDTVNSLEQLPSDAPDVVEDGATFLDNAKIKAYAYFNMYGMPALADDSGLCVECLNDAPGIYSARYAETPKKRIEKLLKAMEHVKDIEKRRAYFVTRLVLALSKDHYITVEGRVYGNILFEELGENGFGYDPVFLPDGFNRSYAEMSFEEKNEISHRKNALVKMRGLLENIFDSDL